MRIWPSVDVLALFQHPNIRELSQAIEGRTVDALLHDRSETRQIRRKKALFAVGNVFFDEVINIEMLINNFLYLPLSSR